MDTKLFDEYQKQLVDWQKKFLDACLDSLPNDKKDLDFSENLDKALVVQEQMVNSCLDAQAKTVEMMLDAQKKFWAEYFNVVRQKSPQKVATTVWLICKL